jgi:hypothetical protein
VERKHLVDVAAVRAAAVQAEHDLRLALPSRSRTLSELFVEAGQHTVPHVRRSVTFWSYATAPARVIVSRRWE